MDENKQTETIERLNQFLNKIETEYQNEKKEKEEIKNKYPKKLQRPFLNKQKKFLQKNTEEKEEELKEFVVLLMKNNGHSDFLEGVQAGEFYIKTMNGDEKSILLTPNKLTTFNYNKQYFKGWVVHEDNMSPYPQEPIHNAEMFRKTTQKIAMNYRDANEAKMLNAKSKMWMIIIGGGLLAIYILFIVGKNAGWFGGVDTATIIQNATTNITTIASNTGVNIG